MSPAGLRKSSVNPRTQQWSLREHLGDIFFWLKKICYISYGLCNCSERYMEVFTQYHPHTVQIHMHSPLTFGLKLLIEQKMQTDLAISDAGAVTSLISYEHVIYDL